MSVPDNLSNNEACFDNSRYNVIRIMGSMADHMGLSPAYMYVASAADAIEYGLMDEDHTEGVSSLDDVSIIVANEHKDEVCPICYNEMSGLSEIRKTTCGHLFCRDCISQWLSQSKTCPMCVTQLQSD